MKNQGTAFTEFDRMKAIAIVNIFETGRPFGEYSALAVLNDGAGLSYGISQFTHRSGSLYAVVRSYLENGGRAGRGVLAENLPLLKSNAKFAIDRAIRNQPLRNALKTAAAADEMRAAQHEVAFERYMLPAVEACVRSGFVLPLSLAVIYDSMNHGSWERIRDHVRVSRPHVPTPVFEKAWITAYVNRRHQWLRGVPRLKVTAYRTTFFLGQIVADNWQLDLPLTVHGYSLRAENFPSQANGDTALAAGHSSQSASSSDNPPDSPPDERENAFPAETRPPKQTKPVFEKIEKEVAEAAAAYDRFDAVVRTILTRSDAAKSLWTTVVGTLWQTFWAIGSFLIGLPTKVWLAVAIIAAVLMILYLYRQFALGRIREMRGLLYLTSRAERQAFQDSAKENYE